MPCAVAVTNSPVFSPSRISSNFCKPSSPDNLKLHHHHTRSPPPPRSPLSTRLNNQYLDGFREINEISGDHGSSDMTILKRKRPGELEIPIMPLGYEVEEAVQRLEEVVDEGEGYSVYCKRGRKRGAMEDRYSAFVDSHHAFFAVYDGHGGENAAEFAANNMHKYIMTEVSKRSEEEISEAVSDGYLTSDAMFLKEDVNSGSCCLTALIKNGSLVVSNAGDCRAVMSRNGIAEALTSDHKPSRNDERERIEALGGYVDCHRGVWRIQGSLAVSRGIGDRHLKQWVTAQPETKVVKISSDCELLILASDGLWDKVSNQEAVDVVRPLCVDADRLDSLSACKKLVELSIGRGSNDDASVMIIQLSHIVSRLTSRRD